MLLPILIAALLAALLLTGRWRWLLAPFRINPRSMMATKLGLDVRDEEWRHRVDRILYSFVAGFNAKLTSRTDDAWESFCDSLDPLLQPFAHEGVAMAVSPHAAFFYNSTRFEESLVKRHPHRRYLYYVGLGFWSGMARHSPAAVVRRSRPLDALHRYLCFDGYGFKLAFFDHPKKPNALRRLHRLPGYARNAAFQGVGRALWFRFMSDPQTLIRQMRSLDSNAKDAAAGAGLASVFVFPDRLEIAQELGRALPAEWQAHFHLGMCFALKARVLNSPDDFERYLAGQPAAVQQAARASIRECDRVELLVRADHLPNGYQEWRRRVTDWLTNRVEFPMVQLRPAPTDSAVDKPVAV